MTPDGRPYVEAFPGDDWGLRRPEPARDGDPVYYEGVRIGTVCIAEEEEWIETVPTKDMPPALAVKMKAATTGDAP